MSGVKDKTAEVLESLQSKGDQYAKTFLLEQTRENELSDAIQHVNEVIEKYRAMSKTAGIKVMNMHVLPKKDVDGNYITRDVYEDADGVDVGRQAQGVTRKALNILETRYSMLLQRKSVVTNTNTQLKTYITHHRKIRLQTDLAHAQLVESLADHRRRIERLLSESTKVLERRQKLVDETKILEQFNKAEKDTMALTYKRQGEFIQMQNEALKDLLMREGQNEFKKSLERSIGQGSAENDSKFHLVEQEDADARRSLEEDVRVQEGISDLQDKFETLQRLMSCESLEEVINKYLLHEDDMFSLYNYTQTVGSETEGYEEVCAKLTDEMRQFEEALRAQNDAKRVKQEELQAELDKSSAAVEHLRAKNSLQRENVEVLTKRVLSLFNKLGCEQLVTEPPKTQGRRRTRGDDSLVLNIVKKIASLTRQSGSGETSVLEYIAVIEQRAVDIIADYELCLRGRDVGGQHALGPSSAPDELPRFWEGFAQSDETTKYWQGLSRELHQDQEEERDDKPVNLAQLREAFMKGGLTTTTSANSPTLSMHHHSYAT